MIKKISVITAILISGFSPKSYSAITIQNIKDLLGKYCYPTEGSTCSDEECADYDFASGQCHCIKDERFWDKENRVCKECKISQIRNKTHDGCVNIKCPTGYGGQVMTTCPKGYGLIEIKNGKCPSGMYLYKFQDE